MTTPILEVPAAFENPHLPPAPADGKHNFRDSMRCRACGAYGGSTEADRPCVGQWAESGKARVHAGRLFLEDWLHGDAEKLGPPRRVIAVSSRRICAVRTSRMSIIGRGDAVWTLELECGDLLEFAGMPFRPSNEQITFCIAAERMFSDADSPLDAGCRAEFCKLRHVEEHVKLNPGSRPFCEQEGVLRPVPAEAT